MTSERLVPQAPRWAHRVSFLREGRGLAAAVSSWIWNGVHSLRWRAARVTPGRWFLVLFTLLLLGFAIALLYQPAVGRGGR